MRKNQDGILTKLLISLLIISLEYQTSYESSANTLTLLADMKTNSIEYS